MENLVKRMESVGIIPVVVIEDAKDAVALAGALKRGGIECAEVTFRTAAAEESIRLIAKEYPEFLIGAGTVLTPKQADCAMAAGASFIVSPGLNPEVVKHCIAKGYPIIPGVVTPSEVELGLSLGLKYLKFFPAEAAGGVKMIKAMSAPYGMVRFMPTGGVGVGNVRDYLDCKAVFACGGSWMVPKDMIANGEFDKIEQLTREAKALVK